MKMRDLLHVPPFVYGVLGSSSMIDFEGHLAVVFFTAGCNFRCGWCHNAAMIHAARGNLSWEDVERVLRNAEEEWVDGVCITGGEPTLHKDLPSFVGWLKDRGLKVKLDTNGSFPARLAEMADLVDYVAMDVKSSRASYSRTVGVTVNADRIYESVEILRTRFPGRHEFRTTIVPGIHDEEEMAALARELAGVEKYILQPFVPQEGLYDPAFSRLERTDVRFLEKIRDIVSPYIPRTVIRGGGM